MKWVLVAVAFALVEGGSPEPWPPNLPELECALHQLAFEYGSAKVSTNAASLHAALRLDNCSHLLSTKQLQNNAETIRRMDHMAVKQLEHHGSSRELDARTLFVATTGSDNAGDGTLAKPFASLVHARDVARKLSPSVAAPVIVSVREGKYYLSETLVLDSRDSHTTFSAYTTERVILSGGFKLSGLEWTPYKGGPIQMAKVTLPPSPPPLPTPPPIPTPPPTPKPAVNTTCGFEYNTDFGGNDVLTTTASSPDACCALCKVRERENAHYQCTFNRSKSCRALLFRPSVSPFHLTLLSMSTALLLLPQSHPDCKAFTIEHKAGGNCWLKSSDKGRTPYTDHVSGRPGMAPAPGPGPSPGPPHDYGKAQPLTNSLFVDG
jgi:hypothetical protein